MCVDMWCGIVICNDVRWRVLCYGVCYNVM